MLACATAAALFATAASQEAEISSLRTVRAGELGKFDLVTWKVKSERNRFFLTLDGKLKANSYLDLVMANSTQEEAEYYFAKEYTNTSRAVEEQAQGILERAAKLVAIQQEALANPAKAAMRARTGMRGPVTVSLLEYFSYTWGITADEAPAA